MATGDLTTLAGVKLFLGIQNDADDALLSSLISQISFAISNYTNRNLLSQSYVERYDGNSSSILMLRQHPITAVSALAINGAAVSASPDGIAAGYAFDGNYVFLTKAIFPKGIQNIQVSYTAGYASVPFDVAEAVTELVADRYRVRGRLGESSKSMAQGGSTSYDMSYMSDKVKGSLSNYRRMIPI